MKEPISIVIPAYNEESRIAPTLTRIHSYFRDKGSGFEIIVVDDGSSDNTALVVKDLSERLGEIRLIRLSDNAGKGGAIKSGVGSAGGALVLTCDADLSTPIEEVEKLSAFLQRGFDIAIGSRGLSESNLVVRQPWYREKMGKMFNNFVNFLVLKGIRDTQCGFKLFHGDIARRLFSRSLIRGFAHDVEILFLARKDGYKIAEVPVKWLNAPGSKVRLLRDPLKMFLELVRIRSYYITGKYQCKLGKNESVSFPDPN
jgi:dolichyl-phosphate beta-glucosyltransferase